MIKKTLVTMTTQGLAVIFNVEEAHFTMYLNQEEAEELRRQLDENLPPMEQEEIRPQLKGEKR